MLFLRARWRLVLPMVFCMLLAGPGVAAAAEVAGAASAVVAGKTLVLGGAGYRYKGPFKVNLVELYALRPYTGFDDLVRMDGPKRIAMTIQTDVASSVLGKSMTRGIEDNLPKGELTPLVPSLIRMGDLFGQHKTLGSGTKVFIDFLPGVGTVVIINGVVQGEPFTEPSLFRAILSIWLGPVPVDFRLKDALLGVKS